MNDDLDFQYGEETSAYQGCGATLFGEFWYFGGQSPLKRQVSLSEKLGLQLMFFRPAKLLDVNW